MNDYFIDDVTTAESTGGPGKHEGFYAIAIRNKDDRSAWVFRFPGGQASFEYAMKTLDSLNGVQEAAA